MCERSELILQIGPDVPVQSYKVYKCQNVKKKKKKRKLNFRNRELLQAFKLVSR